MTEDSPRQRRPGLERLVPGPQRAPAQHAGYSNRAVYCDGQTPLGWTYKQRARRGHGHAGEPLAGHAVQHHQCRHLDNGVDRQAGRRRIFAGAEEWIRTNELALSIIDHPGSVEPACRRAATRRGGDRGYPTSGAASPTGANDLNLAQTSSALKNLRVSRWSPPTPPRARPRTV